MCKCNSREGIVCGVRWLVELKSVRCSFVGRISGATYQTRGCLRLTRGTLMAGIVGVASGVALSVTTRMGVSVAVSVGGSLGVAVSSSVGVGVGCLVTVAVGS